MGGRPPRLVSPSNGVRMASRYARRHTHTLPRPSVSVCPPMGGHTLTLEEGIPFPAMSELTSLDATAQAELVRSGEVAPIELVDASIAAIEKLNPELNAVIHERFDAARADAAGTLPDGPFRGVPFVHKDHDGANAGMPQHHGCQGLKAASLMGEHDSNQTRRFREAGFVNLGRTNCPEFGLQPTTEPEAYGPTRNPWDVTRSTGGSSGGSAAAVASRMVAMASAGDGGGSIRWPASACGLVGLKTTRGRISLAPEGEWWGGLVVHGFLARSVRDTAAILDVAAGPETGDPYRAPAAARSYREEVGAAPGKLRIGMVVDSPGGLAETTPESRAAAESTAALLESLGHTVELTGPSGIGGGPEFVEGLLGNFTNVFNAFVDLDLTLWGKAIGKPRLEESDVEPGTWALAESGRLVSAATYYESLEALRTFSREMQSWWDVDGWDILLTPTSPEVPPTLGQFAPTPDNPLAGLFRSTSIVLFLAPFNVTGQPAISLPMHATDDGVPIGVQLVGGFGREDVLLRVAAQLEEARPWADRTPPVSA